MPSDNLFSHSFIAMASECNVYVYATSEEQANAITQKVENETKRIEAKYSRYLSDSFLTRINQIAEKGQSIQVDDETAKLLDFASNCYHMSDGLFDITSGKLRRAWDFSAEGARVNPDLIESLLPSVGWHLVQWEPPCLSFSVPGMAIDFGGIGKEYAVDQAVAICREMGIQRGIVDYGGDVGIIGPHPTDEPWEIYIQNPNGAEEPLLVIPITQGAIASSGSYERYIELEGQRYSHILNPKTGWPVQGLLAVSILDSTCINAGATSTIAMLKGKEGIEWLNITEKPYLWVDAHGQTGGLLFQ